MLPPSWPRHCSEAGRLDDRQKEESVYKPGPVPRKVVTIHLRRALPLASSGLPGGAWLPRRTGRPYLLLGLAPDGVYLAEGVTPHAGELLPHLFTLTSGEPKAVCFLWHCPRVAPPGTFPSVLPCGARTFLDP
jgi:hypothetical protein